MAEHDQDQDTDPLDEVAETFAEECRRGMKPSVDDYATRFPQLATKIRQVLPAVELMEQSKERKAPDSVPSQLGDYSIIREIGRGGMGVVYEAEHKNLGRRVAIKVAPALTRFDPVRLERFRREAQAAARLHHTNIVPVFGVGDSAGLHYYVMQYIVGAGLNEILTAMKYDPTKTAPPMRIRKSLPPPPNSKESAYWRWVARIGVQVADALTYAHEQGTLHRDIKPANILLDGQGIAWVADFGLAKLSDGDDLTQTGDIVGTLQYLAPEAMHGKFDARSDVYGLAITLYELVTQQQPFKDKTTLELLKIVGEVEPVRPRDINKNIPYDLETIILKGSARNPNDRYANAKELADDLRRFADDRPVFARQFSIPERMWRWSRRNRALTALGSVAIVSLLTALVVGWVGYVNTRDALARESKRREESEEARKRSDANVQMSLKAFEDVFNALGKSDTFGPGPMGPNPIGFNNLNNPNGPNGPNGPQQGPNPRMPRIPRESQENAAILQSILKFYDRFAGENSTDSNLQFEAARAHLRVGELQIRTGNLLKAQDAYTRALSMSEKLSAEKKALPDFTQFMAQLRFGLGTLHQRSAQPTEALEEFRQAAELQKVIAAQSPDDVEQVSSYSSVRFSLADAYGTLGRPKEQRQLLEESLRDLEAISKKTEHRRINQELNRHYHVLADILEETGDRKRAFELRDKADALNIGPRPADDRSMIGPGPDDRSPDWQPQDKRPLDRRGPDDRRMPDDRRGPPPDGRMGPDDRRGPPPDGRMGPDDRRGPPPDGMDGAPPPRRPPPPPEK